MTLEASVMLTARWLSFTMLLQAVEIFVLSKQINFQRVWSYKNLRHDLESGLPLNAKIIQKIFSISALQKITAIQILLSCVCVFEPHVIFFIGLFVTHLLILFVRWFVYLID